MKTLQWILAVAIAMSLGCAGDEAPTGANLSVQVKDEPLECTFPNPPERRPLRGHVIPAEQIEFYTDFWKTEFLARNGMSQAYFDAHITDVDTWSHTWNSGISFRVIYLVTIDWAVISTSI